MLQGAQRISSSPSACFQAKRTVPKRVSSAWPSRWGASHEEVARRTAAGTPTSKLSGPALMLVLHSPGAGASANLAIRKKATHAVTTRAASA